MGLRLSSLIVVSALLCAPVQAQLVEQLISDGGIENGIGKSSVGNRDDRLPPLKVRVHASSQAAGTPNQIGLGAFVPLDQSKEHVFYIDAQAGVNFSDINDYSSIVTTQVKGVTVSTSTRLGYRWLNGDQSMLYGLNAGYDTRPMATGNTVDGIDLFGSEQSVFFQQVGLSAEVASRNYALTTYALLPVGQKEHSLNWYAAGGALDTYGVDVKMRAFDGVYAALGYYYQQGDLGAANGSGVKGELIYDISDDVSISLRGTYDEAFEGRVSGNIVYRFGETASGRSAKSSDLLLAFSSPPENRDVRVHDCHFWDLKCDWHDIKSGVRTATGWVNSHVGNPLLKGMKDLGISASEAGELMHALEEKLGQKVAKIAFKKVLKRVLKWSEDTGEEDTKALREFADEVRAMYDFSGIDGVADVVVDNPELTAEALAEAAEVAAE